MADYKVTIFELVLEMNEKGFLPEDDVLAVILLAGDGVREERQHLESAHFGQWIDVPKLLQVVSGENQRLEIGNGFGKIIGDATKMNCHGSWLG